MFYYFQFIFYRGEADLFGIAHSNAGKCHDGTLATKKLEQVGTSSLELEFEFDSHTKKYF